MVFHLMHRNQHRESSKMKKLRNMFQTKKHDKTSEGKKPYWNREKCDGTTVISLPAGPQIRRCPLGSSHTDQGPRGLDELPSGRCWWAMARQRVSVKWHPPACAPWTHLCSCSCVPHQKPAPKARTPGQVNRPSERCGGCFICVVSWGW